MNELARMGADVKVSMESNTARHQRRRAALGRAGRSAGHSRRRGPRGRRSRRAGETEIIGLEYIDRGYERLEEMLSALGGQVQRSSGVTPLVEPAPAFFETSEYPAQYRRRG